MEPGWHDRLKSEVPRGEIPDYLSDLQTLVAALRRARDEQRVPSPHEIQPRLTPLLKKHATLTLDYLSPPDYREAVHEAIAQG